MIYYDNMEEMVNKQAAAKYLQVSVVRIERLMRSELPYVKLGQGRSGRVRFMLRDLNDYIERRRVRPVAAPVPEAGTTT